MRRRRIVRHDRDRARESLGHPQNGRVGIRMVQFFPRNARVILQRTNGGNQHNNAGVKIAVRGDDVKILLRAEIKPESRFGHHIVRQTKRQFGSDDTIGPLGNVGKWASMDNGRHAFGGLHKIGHQRVF